MKRIILVLWITLFNIYAVNALHLSSIQTIVEDSPFAIRLLANGRQIVHLTAIKFDSITVDSLLSITEKADTLKLRIKIGEIQQNLIISKVKNGIHFFCDHTAANEVTITLEDLADHFFGLAEPNFNGNNPDIRGKTVKIGMNGVSGPESRAAVFSAFFMSSNGYGSFFDSFANGEYVLGNNGKIVLSHQTGKLDWYIFYGPTGDKIHEGYFSVIGNPKKVPIWACGPTIWRDNNQNRQEVIDDVFMFSDLKIPITQIWIDRPYSNGNHSWSKMDFNTNFSNPGEWIGTLNNTYGVQVLTWISPALFGDISECPDYLEGGHVYIDLSNPDSKNWYQEKIKVNQHQYGIVGHKIDRVDESFNVSADWFDGTAIQIRHNRYAFLSSLTTSEMLHESFGDHHFIFARAAYHRTQPYLSALWGGDVGGDWQNMRSSLCNAIRCGFMGFPIWGSDGGGYYSAYISEELYIRWLQWCLWSGFFEVKLDGRLPWNYSSAFQETFRNIFKQRMELIPYIYSLANTSYCNGVLMKPMTYIYPEDAKTFQMYDQYIFGTDFLIAPIMNNNSRSRNVYFPEGDWIDYYDYSNVYSGGQTQTITAPLNRIPVFIRKGAIFPTGNIYEGNQIHWIPDFNRSRNLVIHAFPGASGDTCSFAYIDYLRDNRKQDLSLIVTGNDETIIQFEPMSLNGKIQARLDVAPQNVYKNGLALQIYDYSDTTKILTVPFSGDESITLRIEGGLETTYYPGEIFMDPETFKLFQNYPNPFNQTTKIQFQIPKDSEVTIKIYNISGQEIRTLMNESKKAGVHSVIWDGNDNARRPVATGLYLFRIEVGEFVKLRKGILLR